jgi:hypothetical protein
MSASAVIPLTETHWLTDWPTDEFTPGYLDFPWVDPGEIRPQGNRWIYDFPWGIGKFVQNWRNAPPQGNWRKYPGVPRGKWP